MPSAPLLILYDSVAILLTALSFYYSGLTSAQIQETLKQLLRADDPSLDYSTILQLSTGVPASLSTWTNINVDDDGQCAELWQHLRYNPAMINYYMNIFVFPRHAKTFERKLVSSGWDLPLYPSTAESQDIPANKDGADVSTKSTSSKPASLASTTGFSGTNDNRLLLPLTIEQDDLSQLTHTNAEVLTYLLQSRNRHYLRASHHEKRLSKRQLLTPSDLHARMVGTL